MPAIRSSKAKSAAAARPSSKRSNSKPEAAVAHGDTQMDEASLELKVAALRTAKLWPEIMTLLDAEQVFPLSSASLQGAYCRAFFHSKDPSSTSISNAKTTSVGLLKTTAESVDALLCAGKIAQMAGEYKSVADRALEAYKASGYKDNDALALLKTGQSSGSGAHGGPGLDVANDSKDHYETLHVSRTAPDVVITAAHGALSLVEGSAEANAADEALGVLSDPERRAKYDESLSRRKTGGGGREFTGGSEILKQLGEALGLVFPAGFVFPPSGRFQGGFGGGFEYTWGAGDEGDLKDGTKSEDTVQLATNGLLFEAKGTMEDR